MLRKLFPGKKRSVLELVLRRCNHDLLRAVEHFNATHVRTNFDTHTRARYMLSLWRGPVELCLCPVQERDQILKAKQ